MLKEDATDSTGDAGFSITLLDVGRKEYGDCILCQAGDTSILIDGSHPGDHLISFSIPRQLRYLLRQPTGTVRVSLLVITHVHSDHYGCLPEMIAAGTLTADFALVADPGLGWGEIPDEEDSGFLDALAAAHPVARRLALASREELPSLENEAALRDLLDAAESARERYQAMLDRLADDGTQVFRYGVDDHQPVLDRFADAGLRILGPSREQLIVCARVIRDSLRDSMDRASAELLRDEAADEVTLLRALVQQDELTDAGLQKGSALNNQSIVLQLEIGGQRALLTGDMQLVNSEIPELEEERQELRQRIREGRPYAFFKVPHHASTDSFDRSVLDDVRTDGETLLLGISTGTDGIHHPSRRALEVLGDHTEQVTWARTDRNGQCEFRFTPQGNTVRKRRGTLNDATPKQQPSPRDEMELALATDSAVAVARDAGAATERIEIHTPKGVQITVTIS